MSLDIVTGYKGAAHITAQQDRYINQGGFGTGTVVLPTGNQLDCTIVSATQVSITDGAVSLQGCVGVQDPGASWTGTVDAGEAGMNRIDYICAKYTKSSKTGAESMSFVIKKGTPVAGTPTPPTYEDGRIEEGDIEVEAPIWQINIEGLTIVSVTRVAPVLPTQAALMSSLAGLTDLLSGKAPVYYFTSGDDVNAARESMNLRACFMFQGGGTFSQDVLELSSQVNAFGIGFKNSSSSVALLTICGGQMYYSTYSNTGAGTVYHPLNLTTNI